MNIKTRNEIASWLLDRVAEGAHEEDGSMDWESFNDGQEEHHVTISKSDGEYLVYMAERNFAPDFILTSASTEEEIQKLIDEWYDEY